MDDLYLHNITKIVIHDITTHTDPFLMNWRKIVVTNEEGKQFTITLFGKAGGLEIREDTP